MAKENLKEVPEKVVAVKEAPTAKGPEKTTVKTGEYNLEIVRDFHGKIDPFYLSAKDPNYAYRFLREDSKSGGKNISIKTGNLLFDKGGWQICPKEHLFRLGVKETELSAEGTKRRGDTVLAFMPKSLFEEKRTQKDKEAKEKMDAIKRKVAKGDPSKGLLTEKQLGMK